MVGKFNVVNFDSKLIDFTPFLSLTLLSTIYL